MAMSLTEIIEELPKLTHKERRELCRRVLELESEKDMELCDHVARKGFAVLEQMEIEDQIRDQRKTG